VHLFQIQNNFINPEKIIATSLRQQFALKVASLQHDTAAPDNHSMPTAVTAVQHFAGQNSVNCRG
jgi:putative salt-induced outer membrane protein YdiY